eukprot:scaffold9338_cov113-Isochrysis_galbana.AAC.1
MNSPLHPLRTGGSRVRGRRRWWQARRCGGARRGRCARPPGRGSRPPALARSNVGRRKSRCCFFLLVSHFYVVCVRGETEGAQKHWRPCNRVFVAQAGKQGGLGGQEGWAEEHENGRASNRGKKNL